MPALDPYNRSRCYTHLGYGNGGGIPAPDVAALESAMNTLRDNYQVLWIVRLLSRCDTAFNLAAPGQGGPVEKELISGDINRSVIRTTDPARAQKLGWDYYLLEVDHLAQELWVPNYRAEITLRYRYERAGGESIALIPGPADTTIGATQYLQSNGYIGFGF